MNSLLEPGGNPPDPPLEAWLADGEDALGPACASSGLCIWPGPVMRGNLGQASCTNAGTNAIAPAELVISAEPSY